MADPRRIKGSVVGLSVIVAAAGVMMFVSAGVKLYNFNHLEALVCSLLGIVAWIVAGRLFIASRYVDGDNENDL